MLFKQFGNIKIDVKKTNIDMLSLSGHKIYAPKGVGALYVKDSISFDRFMDGGHQEKNKRSGTENVAQIVGLGKACELAENNSERYNKKISNLRDYCQTKLIEKIPILQINGDIENRLPGNLSVSFKGQDSEEILYKLDRFGICASGGSACSSKQTSPSHVLTAIGLTNDLAKGTIRITFGDYNTKEEIDYFIEKIKFIIQPINE